MAGDQGEEPENCGDDQQGNLFSDPQAAEFDDFDLRVECGPSGFKNTHETFTSLFLRPLAVSGTDGQR